MTDSIGVALGLVVAAVLVADNTTGVGTLDDPLIPWVLGASGATAFASMIDWEAFKDKFSSEIDKLVRRNPGPPGQQYALRAARSGMYLNRSGAPVELQAGDVWKYGKTINPTTRYSGTQLSFGLAGGPLNYVVEFQGTEVQALIVEKMKIYQHLISNGEFPPGNCRAC